MEFDQIYKEYCKDIFLYVRSLSGKSEIAEEITQETFLKALKAISKFDGSKNVQAWLFAIARNTYYTYYRRQKIYDDRELLDNVEKESLDFVEKIVDKETAFSIYEFLNDMDEPYKEVFSLRVFGELPYEKIGKSFGKSPEWARVTFYRAKKQILKYMEEIGYGRD